MEECSCSCSVELRQIIEPEINNMLTKPFFLIQPTVHYLVHYFPVLHYMNLRSYRPKSCFSVPLTDAGRTIFTTRFLSHTLIPQSQFDSILNTFFSKATSIASDSHSDYNFFRVSMSLKVIWTQPFNLQTQLTWDRILHSDGVGRRFSANLPAMEESVRELETDIYNGEEDRECPICLKDFEVGEEMTVMPCFHYYHRDCILKWLNKSHLCPSCRFPLPVCRVVEGAFPFYNRKPFEIRLPGGDIVVLRSTSPMSTSYRYVSGYKNRFQNLIRYLHEMGDELPLPLVPESASFSCT